MSSLYPIVEEKSWYDLLEMTRPLLPRPPFSAHFPVNMPHSKDMVIVDGALNAVVLQEPPNVNVSDPVDRKMVDALHCRTLSFCLDEPPFVMDFHHAKLERIDGDLPQLRATYYAYYTLYTFEYAMGENGRLCVRVSVRNEDVKSQKRHVWLKMAHPKERSFHDYHYVTFHFTANNFPKFDTTCDFQNGAFLKDGQAIGRVTPGDFQTTWHESIFKRDNEYTDYRFIWDSPYFPHPEYRLPSAKNMLQLSVDLAPNEEKSFEITMDTTLTSALPECLPAFDQVAQWNTQQWKEQEAEIAQVDFGDEELNHRFKAIQRVSRQLIFKMQWPNYGETLFPCQGGTSERFYMWVWEALCEFQPMMRLGYLKEARNLLEFIFSLQDGGFPPIGEFVPAKGAIGTTGPKWACVTGSALTWASIYLECSHDEDFARKYLDKMASACSWITAQIRAEHPADYPYPRLMPTCQATDADHGRLLIITDNWCCRGMELAAKVLTQYGHPDAEKYTRIAQEYKADLMQCLKDMTRPDGYVQRQIDATGNYCVGFENCDSYAFFAYSGLISLHDPSMRKFIRWQEENACQDFFFGPMTPHLIYIGTGEEIASLVQIANGETKKAWCAIKAFEQYGCSQDCYLTQERFDIDDPEHSSWQPNGSNNGRMLDMELARLYLETDQKIILLGGFAPFELDRPGRRFAIHGLRTQYGRLDLEAQDHQVKITWDTPPNLPIVLPDGWKVIQ